MIIVNFNQINLFMWWDYHNKYNKIIQIFQKYILYNQNIMDLNLKIKLVIKHKVIIKVYLVMIVVYSMMMGLVNVKVLEVNVIV